MEKDSTHDIPAEESQPYPNLLFSITPFDGLNLVSLSKQDSWYPFQLFLIEEFDSPRTPSDFIKISLEPHHLSYADQWSEIRERFKHREICSEHEWLTLEMVGLTICHKSNSVATIVTARV